jgi:ABC-type dipeptide/oligopeptide/nickel transport system permease component
MAHYLVRRLLWAAVLFITVMLVTFVIFFVIPADPARPACDLGLHRTGAALPRHRCC